MAPPTWSVGQVLLLAASDVNSWFIPLAAVKTSDQSVTSSTTVVNDTELFVVIPNAGTWIFFVHLDYEAATGGDIKWNFTSPGTVRYAYENLAPGGTASAGNESTGAAGATAGGQGAGVIKGIMMMGTLVCAASGNLQIQWAQNTSNSTATTVHAQSCLVAFRCT